MRSKLITFDKEQMTHIDTLENRLEKQTQSVMHSSEDVGSFLNDVCKRGYYGTVSEIPRLPK